MALGVVPRDAEPKAIIPSALPDEVADQPRPQPRPPANVDVAVHIDAISTRLLGRDRVDVLEQATALLLRTTRGETVVEAIGDEARSVMGRTPGHMTVVLPYRDFGVADYENAGLLLRGLIAQVRKPRQLSRLRVVACVPSGASTLERKTLRDVCKAAGAWKVALIETSWAAALGADLPIESPSGHMVLDIGEGASDIGVYSLSGSVYSSSTRAGLFTADAQVFEYLRYNHNLTIGPTTIDKLRSSLLNAEDASSALGGRISVVGRDLMQGVPRQVEVSSRQVAEAVRPTWQEIINMCHRAIQATPEELLRDIRASGIALTGTACQTPGLAELLETEIGYRFWIPKEGKFAAVRGAAKVLQDRALWRVMLGWS